MESNDDILDIDSLPEEIILKIFGYLNQNQLGQIARVCRRWSILTSDPVLWKKVDVKFWPSTSVSRGFRNDFQVYRIFHRSQNIITKHFINRLPPSCVTYIRLDFKNHGDWSDQLNFEELCVNLHEKCPHLVVLFLHQAKISVTLLSLIHLCTQFLPNLKRLVLRFSSISNCSARIEHDGGSKIEVLDLSSCYLGRFSMPPFSRMPHLKQLRLSKTYIDDSWFEDESSFLNQLHVLDVGYTFIESGTFQAIQNYGHNLRELYLCSSYVQESDLNMNNSAFPHLKTICLKGCHKMTCECVVSLIRLCQSLQNVYVDIGMAESYAAHPFVVVNKCKLGVVKVFDCYYTHHN